jgi:hypothetical protein
LPVFLSGTGAAFSIANKSPYDFNFRYPPIFYQDTVKNISTHLNIFPLKEALKMQKDAGF